MLSGFNQVYVFAEKSTTTPIQKNAIFALSPMCYLNSESESFQYIIVSDLINVGRNMKALNFRLYLSFFAVDKSAGGKVGQLFCISSRNGGFIVESYTRRWVGLHEQVEFSY